MLKLKEDLKMFCDCVQVIRGTEKLHIEQTVYTRLQKKKSYEGEHC